MQDILIVLFVDGLILCLIGLYLVRIHRDVNVIKKSIKR
jgi:hypothetical protein